MEFLFLLFFLWIGYNFVKNFMVGNPSAFDKTNDAMLKIAKAHDAYDKNQNDVWKSQHDGPTARGRARLEQKQRDASPWQNAGVKMPQAYRAKSLEQAARKASHKSPLQRGRRGKNMDQNRHRHSDWGQRGDEGVMSGRAIVILLVILFAVLYAMSRITPEMLEQFGL